MNFVQDLCEDLYELFKVSAAVCLVSAPGGGNRGACRLQWWDSFASTDGQRLRQNHIRETDVCYEGTGECFPPLWPFVMLLTCGSPI